MSTGNPMLTRVRDVLQVVRGERASSTLPLHVVRGHPGWQEPVFLLMAGGGSDNSMVELRAIELIALGAELINEGSKALNGIR